MNQLSSTPEDEDNINSPTGAEGNRRKLTIKEALVYEIPENVVALKERAGYMPTKEEILHFAEWLGFEEGVDDDLMWISRKAMSSFLPTPWIPCRPKEADGATGGDGEGGGGESESPSHDLFYFNPTTGVSMQHHPLDDHWKQLFEECREMRGELYERNSALTKELRGPVTTSAETVAVPLDPSRPMGVGMVKDGSVEYVVEGGQGEQAGVEAGCQVLSVDGYEVESAHDYKQALKRSVDRKREQAAAALPSSPAQGGGAEGAGGGNSSSGVITVEVVFATPMAAAIARCEKEFLCDEDLIARAKLRLAEGPNGPDALEDPYDDEEEDDEDGDDGEDEDEESGAGDDDNAGASDSEEEECRGPFVMDAPPSRY